MGLAASQARYLSLTARKTNVEYEGQQVNQERTALANQSAALYNQMLSLDVPTPPSKTDFTRTVYTYTDPSQINGTVRIDNILKNTVKAGEDQTYKLTITNKIATTTANRVSFAQAYFQADASSTPAKGYIYPEGFGNKNLCYTLQDAATQGTLYQDFNKAEKGSDAEVYTADSKFYSFYNSSQGIYYYIPQYGDYSAAEFAQGVSDGIITDYKMYSVQSQTSEEQDTIPYAYLSISTDGTGRYTSVSYYPKDKCDENGKPLSTTTTSDMISLKLTQGTYEDDDAYDDAMETYEAKKAIYDKTVSDINAKTVIIQQQDKNLELHLDQLDTEQQAIQTEMEAIKKVIDKNIEETFKTFA